MTFIEPMHRNKPNISYLLMNLRSLACACSQVTPIMKQGINVHAEFENIQAKERNHWTLFKDNMFLDFRSIIKQLTQLRTGRLGKRYIFP